MRRRLRTILPLLFLSTMPGTACSLVGCLDHGIELKSNFAVIIEHEGKPLQGVSVKVTDFMDAVRFSGVTTRDGSIRVPGFGARRLLAASPFARNRCRLPMLPCG